jgi:hypothetical protein
VAARRLLVGPSPGGGGEGAWPPGRPWARGCQDLYARAARRPLVSSKEGGGREGPPSPGRPLARLDRAGGPGRRRGGAGLRARGPSSLLPPSRDYLHRGRVAAVAPPPLTEREAGAVHKSQLVAILINEHNLGSERSDQLPPAWLPPFYRRTSAVAQAGGECLRCQTNQFSVLHFQDPRGKSHPPQFYHIQGGRSGQTGTSQRSVSSMATDLGSSLLIPRAAFP